MQFMHNQHILILGIGNILLADEGVGIHIVRELQKRSLPSCVEVIDGGTGGFELIEYVRGKEKVIIVDAVKMSLPAGTIVTFELDDLNTQTWEPLSVHQGGLTEFLRACMELYPRPELIVYGVVPQETSRMSMDLSDAVARQLPSIVSHVLNEATSVISH
jgi:hydrogenase maturation protease